MERRHETITCLLRSLARVYVRLPQESRRVFEGHELELIKRWVVKTMTQEEQKDALYALQGSFLELLAALYTALRVRLSASSSSEALGDARELMRVVEGLLEQMQVNFMYHIPHSSILQQHQVCVVGGTSIRADICTATLSTTSYAGARACADR